MRNIKAVSYTHLDVYKRQALKGISVTIENGEFLGIIGHTGSGKSTFVQHLNGLLHPTTGKVTVNGDVYKRQG